MVKYIFHTLCMHTWCAIFHTLSILTFQGKKCTHVLPLPMLKEIQNFHHKISKLCGRSSPRSVSCRRSAYFPASSEGWYTGYRSANRLLWVKKCNYLLTLLTESEEYETKANYLQITWRCVFHHLTCYAVPASELPSSEDRTALCKLYQSSENFLSCVRPSAIFPT